MNIFKWQVTHQQNNFATNEIPNVSAIYKTHLKEIDNTQKNSEDE